MPRDAGRAPVSKKMARLRVAGPKRTVADERKITVWSDAENREKSRLNLSRAGQRVNFAVANRLVVRHQRLLPGDALFIRQGLEHELFRLPLQHVGHLAAQIFEQRLANAGGVADVYPLIPITQSA